MDSMETKPGRNFLWILTLDYYYAIIISGRTVQTSSFFRIAPRRASWLKPGLEYRVHRYRHGRRVLFNVFVFDDVTWSAIGDI
jgi:hypothetical protein